MRKILFWLPIAFIVYLLYKNACLDYPFGYSESTIVLVATLLFTILILPIIYKKEVDAFFDGRFSRYCLGTILIFFVGLPVFGVLLHMIVFKTFDFEDETLYLNDNYRVVKTWDVISSGGQCYFAVLKREGIREFCVFRSEHCRRIDDPKVIERNGSQALVLKSDSGHGKDTLWFEGPRSQKRSWEK